MHSAGPCRAARALVASLGGCLVAALSGCAFGPPAGTVLQNPTFVPIADSSFVYNQVIDVVDDYFPIQDEEPVRQEGPVLTEGRIESVPIEGATMFEPWRGDSADAYERLDCTLQSIQRRASVRVIPAAGGYLVDIAVFKDLEDVQRPEHATSGAAVLRFDGALERYTEPVGGQALRRGWIPLGRDPALEQRMIYQVQSRVARATNPKKWPWQ